MLYNLLARSPVQSWIFFERPAPPARIPEYQLEVEGLVCNGETLPFAATRHQALVRVHAKDVRTPFPAGEHTCSLSVNLIDAVRREGTTDRFEYIAGGKWASPIASTSLAVLFPPNIAEEKISIQGFRYSFESGRALDQAKIHTRKLAYDKKRDRLVAEITSTEALKKHEAIGVAVEVAH